MGAKQFLVSGAVAALILSPVSAFAVDRVQGTVQRVDTAAFEFTILVDGAAKKSMTFKVSESAFDELELDVNDQMSVEYDASACTDATVACAASAAKVERRS